VALLSVSYSFEHSYKKVTCLKTMHVMLCLQVAGTTCSSVLAECVTHSVSKWRFCQNQFREPFPRPATLFLTFADTRQSLVVTHVCDCGARLRLWDTSAIVTHVCDCDTRLRLWHTSAIGTHVCDSDTRLRPCLLAGAASLPLSEYSKWQACLASHSVTCLQWNLDHNVYRHPKSLEQRALRWTLIWVAY
jgi:hypothetical protein